MMVVMLAPVEFLAAALAPRGTYGTASALNRRSHCSTILEVMRPWYAAPGQSWEPLLLTTPSLDLAVAWGAASYGWLKHTGGRRIGGGTARSYYVGVESSGGAKAQPLQRLGFAAFHPLTTPAPRACAE